MANYFTEFDTTPANVVATLKAAILNSNNWTNIAGGTGHVVSATTSLGAQMAVDLSDAAATSRQIQLGVYRTYSGTGTDKLTRYLCWHSIAGATSDTIHVTLSAGQDHLYFSIEGPRGGETNADSSTGGSWRECFFIGAIVPYFAGDTPTVVCLANTQSNNAMDYWALPVLVGRNRANTASWVSAKLATLTLAASNGGLPTWNAQRNATADGNTYLWPYVVIEDAAGIRGRIGKCFFAGYSGVGTPTSPNTDYPPSIYQRLVYNSENYILVAPHKSNQSQDIRSGFGYVSNSSVPYASPVIAVPTQ